MISVNNSIVFDPDECCACETLKLVKKKKMSLNCVNLLRYISPSPKAQHNLQVLSID